MLPAGAAQESDKLSRDVDQWIEGLGLAKYSALFAENEVDLEVLPDLTEQDL